MSRTGRLVGALVCAGLLAAPAARADDPPASVTFPGTLRDFRGLNQTTGPGSPVHQDFENANGTERGIVGPAGAPLADGKPVYALEGSSSATTHGRAVFDQWYRDTSGINISLPLSLELKRQADGAYVYDAPAFFPADGLGWVALGREKTGPGGHNFSFTTEVHSELLYTGSEVPVVRGDDDIFVFVNDRLALDLGGVHGAQTASVPLADLATGLGLVPGRYYDVDVFQAERHTATSSLRLTFPRPGVIPGTASIPATGAPGDVVTCTPAGWGDGLTLTSRWFRDGTEITGAAGATRTLTAEDAGHELTCRITGSRRTSASADSGVLRVATPPPPTTTTTTTTESTPAPAPPVPAAPVVTAPATVPAAPVPAPAPPAAAPTASRLPCQSRRRFTVTVAPPKGARLRSTTVLLRGRKLAARRAGKGFTVVLDLRRRPLGVYALRIRSRTTAGKLVTATRSFRTCSSSRT